jgi:hypothetical protein
MPRIPAYGLSGPISAHDEPLGRNEVIMADEMTQKRVVVGYFREGGDAHRALNALLDEGFSASQIGAAFRSEPLTGTRTAASPSTRAGEGSRDEQIDAADAAGELEPRRTTDKLYTGTTNSSISGPTSGTGGVTPAGLSPGSGDLFSGPSAHGGIPGGEIPTNLPSDLPHELPSQFDRPAETERRGVSANRAPWAEEARRTFRERRAGETQGQTQARKSNEESMNFGTGEGHLNLGEGEWDYSPRDFENSFSGMGVEPAPARYFSGALRQGGAILTVEAGARAAEAESILERHNGRVRVETESQVETGTDRWESAHEGARVHVFGQIGHHYRSASGAQLDERKAS